MRAELSAFIFPPKEHGADHAFQRPGSEFAKLDSDQVQTLVTTLSIGIGTLTLIDRDRCPPELFRIALRLMAGMREPGASTRHRVSVFLTPSVRAG